MRHSGICKTPYRVAPALIGLPRKSVDKIGAYIFNTGITQGSNRRQCSGSVVPAVHKPEFAVVKRLHSYADTVDACTLPSFDALSVHVFRIDFYGEFFGVGCHKHPCKPAENLRRKNRRRAAAKVERSYRFSRKFAYSGSIFMFRGKLKGSGFIGPCHRVEIAVGAFRMTERHMQIDTHHRIQFDLIRPQSEAKLQKSQTF